MKSNHPCSSIPLNKLRFNSPEFEGIENEDALNSLLLATKQLAQRVEL